VVQHHTGEAIDDPSAIGAIAATGPMPEAFEAVPESVTADAPAPVGPFAAGSDGSCDVQVCPRAVAAATISKTAQATTVMTTRSRGDFPDGLIKVSLRDVDYVFLRRIVDPRAFPAHEVAYPELSDIRDQCLSTALGFGPFLALPPGSVRIFSTLARCLGSWQGVSPALHVVHSSCAMLSELKDR
jgi:hypothetical protein